MRMRAGSFSEVENFDRWVEDFLIVPARYAGCSGISSEDFDGSRMILDLFLEIDELGHDKERRGDNFWSNA